MKKISSEIEIVASAERVWQVLTDFPALPEWSPYIRSVGGKLEVDERLKVYIKGSKGMGMKFKAKVLKVEPNREFRWLGRFLIPGLLDGEQYFSIEPLERDRVRFVQGEIFRGVLVGLMSIMGLLAKVHLDIQEMNQALKERAEQSPG